MKHPVLLKINLLLFCLLLGTSFLSAQQSTSTVKTVSGTVTYLDAPIPDVNIIVKGSSRGARTNSKGYYEIQARIGEEIQFSHVSYKTVSVIVEDVTAELHIEMIDISNELEEVVVIVKTSEGETLKRTKKAEAKFESSRGAFNPKTAGYAIGFVDGNEININFPSIKEALRGKISGYEILQGKAYIRGKGMTVTQDYPVAWEVDGVFTTEEPVGLDLTQIKNVYALKGLAATNKYGTLGVGGVIVIQTIYGGYGSDEARKKAIAENYTNQNFYGNDAFNSIAPNKYDSAFGLELTTLNDKEKAFKQYSEQKTAIDLFTDHIAIANVFYSHYNDPALASEILTGLSEKHKSNPEILKAIAYQLQYMGMKRQTIDLYKKITRLRPKYAQSYRDLANAYVENDEFQLGWRIYMNYLNQGNDVSDDGIGQIMYNEMEYLYFNRANQAKIKETFVPKYENVNEFSHDIRIVFEWNTTEAEYDLEFVNPEKRAYVFEHSFDVNPNLIKDEKTRGYSSKEFLIDTLSSEDWLINLTYRGNKTPMPTYFKVTTYTHWGEPTQKKKVDLYELKGQRGKVQLMRINARALNP